MSGPTKAGEPSMEEILASIRKIIADDPSKAPSEAPAVASASPSSRSTFGLSPGSPALAGSRPALSNAPSPAGVSDSGNRANPPFGRLSEALRTTFSSNSGSQPSGSFAETRFGQSAPSSPLSAPERGMTLDPPAPVFGAATERARSIDSELDDILDEPLRPAALQDAAKPDGDQGASQWAVWRSPAGKPGDSDASRTTAATLDPSAMPPAGPSQPSLGRPGGFYPASGGGYGQPAAGPSSTPSTFGRAGRFEPTLPGGGAETSGGLGSLVPQRSDDAVKAGSPAATTASPAGTTASPAGMSRSPRFEPNLGSASMSPAPRESSHDADRAPAKPAAVVIAAMPSPAPPAAQPRVSAAFPAASAPAATPEPAASGGMNVPLPPRTTLFSRPFAATKVEAVAPVAAPAAPSTAIPPPDRTQLAFSPAKPVTVAQPLAVSPRAPALPMAAAQVAASASALDALAAGFAASNVHLPASPQAAPATPQAAPAVSAPAPAETAASATAQPRTLEDMVADMVKPMLQKWLTDNMPRIIEKALRSEAGQPGGGGPKLPGT